MKEKIIKIGVFCIVVIFTILGIYQMDKYEVINIQAKETTLKALETSDIGTLAEGEEDPDTYSYHTDTGIWEAIYGTNSFSLPVYQDFQIYCINPASPLRFSYDLLYSEAQALKGKKYTSPCIESGHAATPHEYEVTPPRFVPTETKDLPVAAAYIVSDEPIGQWGEEKQKAIWNLRDESIHDEEDDTYVPADDDLIIGNGNSGNSGPSIYDQEAQDYAEYDSLVRDKGLQPTDKTELGSVYTKVNQETKEYTIGPFNVEYTNGIYGDIAFAGISEIVVIGYNSKGEQVRDDIEVEKIILKDLATGIYGEAVEPQYFEPSNDLKVDETEQVYPMSGQDFQIVFSDPNDELSEDDENRVASISINVKFKYMMANGQYTKLRGTKYMVAYRHNELYNPHKHRYHSGCHTVRTATGSRTCHHYKRYSCHGCETTCYLEETQQQWLMAADAIRSIYEQEIELGEVDIDTTMDLGGHVWEDVPNGKENIADGQSGLLLGQNDAGDKAIPNVKVTLYTEDGEVAKLLSDPYEEGISDEQVMHRVNPTYTDSEGNYLFEGLNPMKKYYVTFEYNGQIYLPTEYLNTEDRQYSSVAQMVNEELYNTNEWKITSKGTEQKNERTDYNEQFAEICSSPLNYVSTNSLRSGSLIREKGNYYNETFSQYDLMGFVLDENGNYYRDENLALVDGFYEINNGNIVETNELQEGIISTRVKEYITENKTYPDDNAMLEIYRDIAGNNEELWKKLQFIEDCKIESYTQPQGGSIDLYPVYNQFRINHAINNEVYTTAAQAQNGRYDMSMEVLDGVTYRPIYPGQFFVNQGLWRRQESDVALRKDIAYAAIRINGKTEIYKYDKRSQMTDEERDELARLRAIYEQDRTNLANYQAYLDYAEQIEGKYYWEIQLRMRDYNNYYATTYTRELYPADYNYRSSSTNNSGADLELYVTYKITVRNSSTSILSEITEVVDYYDRDYEYMEDLSWVMYKNDVNDDNSAISVSQEDYYNTMDQLSFQGNLQTNAKAINSHSESRYGLESAQSGMEAEYDSVYIDGLDSKKLASGEEAYIYLTFKVKSDNNNNGPVILDDDNSLKQNYAEINGYTTYYRDDTELPNNQTMTSDDAAGVIDIDSNPGNLTLEDIQEQGKYEKNFEDDTDRANPIKVKPDEEAIRSINGTVWEDERTQPVSDSVIGDGIRQGDEIGIQGVTVELVERLENGYEYVWQTTKSGSGEGSRINLSTGKPETYTYDVSREGYYEFSEAIPGNYIIRFHYGDTSEIVLTNSNGGLNTVSYNGQDFKSTIYQKDISGEEAKEINSNYNDSEYHIQEADDYNSNGIYMSDAKDLWANKTVNIREIKTDDNDYQEVTYQGRTEVNDYSDSDVTNHIAEVLASPYADTIDDDLIEELINETNMTAETGLIVLYGEYNRTNTDGSNDVDNGSNYYDNRTNGNYTLNNVDFGLTERPKAQLELGKKVTNVRVVLANGNTLFDASDSVRDLAWWPKNEAYNLSNEMTDNKYNEYYGTNHRYYYRTEKIDDLVTGKYNGGGNGLINITMDNELMHGATITISYDLTVTNVGETDYTGQDFYYKGTGASDSNEVTTTANVVVDYVANNLQYRAADDENGSWSVVNDVMDEGLNGSLEEAVKQFNTIIKTESLSTELKPGENTTVGLVLTQLMTAQNTSDDRTYNNIAEITQISNSVGRRMAFSVQGNQDPTAMPAEVDSAKSERIVVLPPTGIGEIVVYISLAVGVLAILIVGVIFIKKKVLKK